MTALKPVVVKISSYGSVHALVPLAQRWSPVKVEQTAEVEFPRRGWEVALDCLDEYPETFAGAAGVELGFAVAVADFGCSR